MLVKISVEGKAYEFDDTATDNVQLMAIERETRMTIPEWADAIGRGSMLAITALVWIIRQKDEPSLEFKDVHFHPASLKIEQVENDEGKGESSSLATTSTEA